MSIQFPILNISLSNLSSQDLEETHIGDLWDYPGDNSIFEEYYNNQKYVDQSGHIFKITGKRKSNFINSIIHFNKKELIFEAQGGLSVAGRCRCLTKDSNTSIEKEGYIPYSLQA